MVRDFTHITSCSNYITVRLQHFTWCSTSLEKHVRETQSGMVLVHLIFLFTLTSTYLCSWHSSQGFLLDWLLRGGVCVFLCVCGGGPLGGSLSMFLLHQVHQKRANWSVKQECGLRVATGWAHLPLNSLWQVRSQPHGGALRPAEKQGARGCRSSASKDLPLHYSSEEQEYINGEISHGL